MKLGIKVSPIMVKKEVYKSYCNPPYLKVAGLPTKVLKKFLKLKILAIIYIYFSNIFEIFYIPEKVKLLTFCVNSPRKANKVQNFY